MKNICTQKLLKLIVDEKDVENNLFDFFDFNSLIILGRYFVYFFGPDFEYTWTDASFMIPYSGLEAFIQQAETSVQNVCLFKFYLFLSVFFFQATSKSEQETLANRFELKVPASKRPHW
jgi:hypothetical protein